jgi:hypothetical protein
MERTKSPPCVTDYLGCREAYKIAYHKWDAASQELMKVFGCSFADLEQHLLEARGKGRMAANIHRYAELGIAFDEASTMLDAARDLQMQRMIDRDLAGVDC